MSENWWQDWEATFDSNSWYREWHEDPRNARGTLGAPPSNCRRVRFDNHNRLLVVVPDGAHQGSDFGLDFHAKGSTNLP